MLNTCGDSGYPFTVPYLRGKAFSYAVSLRVFVEALHHMKEIPTNSYFAERFFLKRWCESGLGENVKEEVKGASVSLSCTVDSQVFIFLLFFKLYIYVIHSVLYVYFTIKALFK